MGMNTDAVQRLYVAYFNRPADPVSMSVYESLLPTDRAATQAELQALAETYFSPSTEYQSMYAGKSNTQIVDQLYQNILVGPQKSMAWFIGPQSSLLGDKQLPALPAAVI